MQQFMHDVVTLTQVQMFIKYWWLWTIIATLLVINAIIINRHNKGDKL